MYKIALAASPKLFINDDKLSFPSYATYLTHVVNMMKLLNRKCVKIYKYYLYLIIKSTYYRINGTIIFDLE